MDKSKLIDLVFTEWAANFKAKSTAEKTSKNARTNFENLFQKMKDVGATFEEAEPYLNKAIKVHLPPPSRAKDVYKRYKSIVSKTEKEFIDEWNETIEAVGTDTFFEIFPPTVLDHDPEPKVYGNMSASEYKAQRRYADQFPVLNTKELVKAWREQQEYNLDVDDVLENVLGDKDEANS